MVIADGRRTDGERVTVALGAAGLTRRAALLLLFLGSALAISILGRVAQTEHKNSNARLELEPVTEAQHLITLEDILSTRTIGDVAIAPDASAIFFTFTQALLDINSNRTALCVVDTNREANPRNLAEFRTIAGLQWWPGVGGVAFLAETGGKNQIWRMTANGRSTLVSRHEDNIESFSISQDGRFIAFVARHATTETELQLLENKGLLFNPLTAGAWSFATHNYLQSMPAVWILDTSSGIERKAWDYPVVRDQSDPDVGKVAWSPDGTHLAISYATNLTIVDLPRGSPTGDRIAIVEAKSGRTRDLRNESGIDSNPVWSPDGTRIAYTTQEITQGSAGSGRWYGTSKYSINVARVATGQTEWFTPASSSQSAAYWWKGSAPPSLLIEDQTDLLGRILKEVTPIGGRQLTPDTDHLSHCDYAAAAHKAACVSEQMMRAPELALVDLDTTEILQLTRINRGYATTQLGEVVPVDWTNDFGYHTRNYLIKPIGFNPQQRYPLLIVLYGFDSGFVYQAQWIPNFPAQVFAAHGFVTLLLNYPLPIGEQTPGKVPPDFGQFSRAYNPLASILKGVDVAVSLGIADRTRVGIMGFSYGGFLTDFAITHSRIFKASYTVDGWRSDIPNYYIGDDRTRVLDDEIAGGPPTGHHLRQWESFSPGLLAANVAGPNLREYHWDVTSQLYTELRRLHKPVELYFYPDAHVLAVPSHRLSAMERCLDWFSFWLKGEEDHDPEKADQYRRWEDLRSLQEASEARHGVQASTNALASF